VLTKSTTEVSHSRWLVPAFARRWFRAEIELPHLSGHAGALSRSSVRNRKIFLERHLIPFFCDQALAEIRAADVQQYYEHRVEVGKPGASTLTTIINTLGQVLAHAHMLELIDTNAVDAWKAGRPRRRGAGLRPIPVAKVLSSLELNKILFVARRDFAEDYPLILLLADTDCRIGEALGLRWSDVNVAGGKLWIRRSVDHTGRVGPTKTGRERQVDLSGRLTAQLAEARPDLFNPGGPVFESKSGGMRNSANFRSRVFKRLVRKALGPDRLGMTPHSLRHTFASLHLAAGSNLKWIQATGGWATAKMLLDVYGHYMPDETAGNADALAALDGPGYGGAPEARGPGGPNPPALQEKNGADDPTRTDDLLITR